MRRTAAVLVVVAAVAALTGTAGTPRRPVSWHNQVAAVNPPMDDPVVQRYLTSRAQAIAREEQQAIGAHWEANFTATERAADAVLRAAKSAVLHSTPGTSGKELPAQHFFDAKAHIDTTVLFRLLRAMPKGAVLHVHPDAVLDVGVMVANKTYDARLWMCGDLGSSSNSVDFNFTDLPHGPASVSYTHLTLPTIYSV